MVADWTRGLDTALRTFFFRENAMSVLDISLLGGFVVLVALIVVRVKQR